MSVNVTTYENLNNDTTLLVSVIIPCHNSQNFVHRAIESVFAQTHKLWELILVENNSNDGTLDVLRKYEALYPQQIKVFIEPKKGAPAARNKGLANASGEWVQYLDADDELLPDKISGQLTLAGQKQSQLIAGVPTFVKIANNEEIRMQRTLHTKDAWIALVKSELGITSANLFGKAALLSVNGWDETLSSSQEYDLMFRIMQNPDLRVAFDVRAVTLIYKTESGISASDDKVKFSSIIDSRVQLRLRIRDFLTKSGHLNTERSEAIQGYVYHELFRNRAIVPQYVNKTMKALGMQIPLKVRVKDLLTTVKKKLLK